MESLTPEQFRERYGGSTWTPKAAKGVRTGGVARRGVRGGRVAGQKGEMNRVERAYAAHLDAEVAAGRVAWYAYEAMTLKLGPDTRFTPDFVVQLPDNEVRLVDTKAWNKSKGCILEAEEDAKVKMRIAAAMPWRVFVTAFDGARWVEKEVCP